jgi:hypothetical protein
MIQADYDESIDGEQDMYSNQMKESPILTHEEMDDNGKEAAKAYGEQYIPEIFKDYEKKKIKMTGPQVKDAVDIRKIPGNTESPMSKIKRPLKPETGFSSGAKYK